MDLCDEYLTSWVEWDYTGMQWYPGGNLDWDLALVKKMNLLLSGGSIHVVASYQYSQ